MKNKILLISIIILEAFLRLWALSSYPAGLNADEAALGYNAFSLLTTGKDEHGHPWPVNLESFGDFKPALYTYILIPFVKVLGLTEFAVRLPSAIFGILSVALIYFLVKEIYSRKSLALMSALVLAVNPWALHFSRGAWETNLATTLIISGVLFFLRYLRTQRIINFALCILNFALSMYSYQSARVIVPLLGLVFVL
jgi:4-amino-4-deoxy-L-arabinose transferase-like glycosyltransferase